MVQSDSGRVLHVSGESPGWVSEVGGSGCLGVSREIGGGRPRAHHRLGPDLHGLPRRDLESTAEDPPGPGHPLRWKRTKTLLAADVRLGHG